MSKCKISDKLPAQQNATHLLQLKKIVNPWIYFFAKKKKELPDIVYCIWVVNIYILTLYNKQNSNNPIKKT